MKLPEDHWYPLLESCELRRKPLGVDRLGTRFVFWRDASGGAQALLDRCPHLGAALSKGCIRDGHIACPFHGFQFDGTGACTHVPALGARGRIPSGVAATSFRIREAHGFIWLWWGNPENVTQSLPFFEELKDGWRHATVKVQWPVHYTRAIENQLDVAHLPFVHRTTIGAGSRTLVEGPHVDSSEAGLRIWVTNRRDDGIARAPDELAAAARDKQPGLQLLFPGVWLLNLGPRLQNFIAFVPVDERRTIYYLRIYHRVRWRLLAWPFEQLMNLSNRFILRQDRRLVITQTPASSLDAGDGHIAADRAIVLYRKWLARAVG
jgi:phenylpropionate dioxygenase-like ring-hydroxylating dioxygenase large terminal subunit